MSFKVAVLSIDGGGIKGIVPAIILARIEQKIQRPICEIFDFIAGTSTGGILALGLTKASQKHPNRPEFAARDLVNMYTREGEKIFSRRQSNELNESNFLGKFFEKSKQAIFQEILARYAPNLIAEDLFSSKYSRTGKLDVIQTYLGDAYIQDALTEVLVTSYATNIKKPIFFSSNINKAEQYRHSESFRVMCEGYKMRDVALATSAAPTYFKPYYIRPIHYGEDYTLIDGGVFANNPTSIAVIEAMKSYEAKTGNSISLQDVLVVSLGTGNKRRGLNIEEMNNWGQIKWIEPLINITLNSQSDIVDYQMEQLLSTNQEVQNYYRFQAYYSEIRNPENFSINEMIYVNDNMDDASISNISNLQTAANQLIDMENNKLNSLINQLNSRFECTESNSGKL